MKTTYTLIVRDTGGAQPVEVRLRQALKLLLRAFGFRCESVRHDETPEVNR